MILYHGSNTGNIKVLKPICKYFVMESTLSNFFPNLFNRVHFRRIWWQGTPGRIPFSHQQYLGLLIRPNPASFRNTNRIVFPLWITFSSWTFILISPAFLLYRFYFFLTKLISASHFHLPDLFYHILRLI